MEEGTSSKAIPLRRSRGTTRAVATSPRRWVEVISTGARYALSPPRQVWLASLGGTAITLRGMHAAWSLMVAEGTTVEGWLRRSLATAPREREQSAG
jgi:hypothetical protein